MATVQYADSGPIEVPDAVFQAIQAELRRAGVPADGETGLPQWAAYMVRAARDPAYQQGMLAAARDGTWPRGLPVAFQRLQQMARTAAPAAQVPPSEPAAPPEQPLAGFPGLPGAGGPPPGAAPQAGPGMVNPFLAGMSRPSQVTRPLPFVQSNAQSPVVSFLKGGR